MTINKTTFDSVQLEYLSKAEQLQAELIKYGFMATRIEKEKDDRCTFHVIYFDGVNDYKVNRDYNDNVTVRLKEWPHYPQVSNNKQAEVYAKYKGQNMKVITAKKLQAMIDNEMARNLELEQLERDAIQKHNDFIVSLDGLKVSYDKERKTGSIVKNGIEFKFELCDDGYVSKKLSLYYAVDNNIESFKKLSDNKYN